MSYLVLARKYRPQTFAEIVGQEHVTRTLSNAFEQERVHHAFLFCGPRGVGKTTAARVLGKALNCEHGPTATPCNTCSACVSISSGTSVNYFEMDGASNRGIDAIRDLTEAVRYQPAALRKKVYVIDEVHMLTTEAFNALLKTLEEPPPHVCFVLATTEPHKLPNTILSRCQRYDFKLVPAIRLGEHVATVFSREEIEVESAAIALIVRESGGSVRDAMSICDQVISYVGKKALTESAVADVLGLADRALTTRIVNSLSSGDARTALESVDSAVARGISEVQLARALVRYARDLSVVQTTGDGAGVVEGSPDELKALADRAVQLEPSRVRLMFERLLRACDDLGQSQQPRLVLDLAIIDLATTEPLEPIGGLIDRLTEIERRLAGGGAGQTARPPRSSQVSRRPEQMAKVAVRPAPPKEAAPPAPVAKAAPVKSAEVPGPPPSWDDVPPPEDQASSAGSSPPVADGEPAAADGEPAAADGEPAAADGEPAAADSVRSAADGEPARPTFQAGEVMDAGAWESVISALEKQRKLSLVRLFQEAKLLTCEEQRIAVGFPTGTIDGELASEREKIEVMKEILTAHFGRPVNFEVRLLSDAELSTAGPTALSLVERSQAAQAAERETREREANKHPMTRLVLDTFGATIKEIKTDV